MARKRRAPSPPPAPKQSSSSEDSGSDAEEVEEERSPRAAAAPMPLQNPQPRAPAVAAEDADEESHADEEEDTVADDADEEEDAATDDAEEDSDADEEEDGESSEPEVAELLPKKAKAEASVQGTRRSFDELQNLYPHLAGCVEKIKTPHGPTLVRAFEFIGDEQASALESMIKAQRIAEAWTHVKLLGLKKSVISALLDLMD